jgi:UDP-N-acetylglucosamine--N-acetylmuramyl-(pentapeptide) pyrophosphoryl-undecaprenol N-acetylglucosamine transferase
MKILIACGGTGGHLIPALNFLNTLELKEGKDQVMLAVTQRKIEKRILPSHYKVSYINISAISPKLDRGNFLAAGKLFWGALESLILVIKFRPQVVIGFGGYASFFLVFFSWGLGVKTIIHEQNLRLGVANRMLAPFVDRIAVSFQQTKNRLKKYRNKVIVTGNPLRNTLVGLKREDRLKFFGFSQNKPILLVMGGSLGAHKINMQFLKAAGGLKSKLNLQIIHLCGDNDFDFLKNEYKKLNIAVKLFAFLDKIDYAYAVADLVVCRAGATTISEIIFCRLPSIIIPYPHAYGHQMENAEVLAEKGCAILIDDDQLDAKRLSEVIIELLNSSWRIDDMRLNFQRVQDMNMEHSLREVMVNLMK